MNTLPTRYLPNDPLFYLQWHLLNTGNTPGAVAGFDINVVRVWPDYTGKGVLVGVEDDGIEEQHPDLIGNYRQNLSWGAGTGPGSAAPVMPGDRHGTSVAGLVVSSNNDIGGVGVAFGAELAAYNHNGGPYPLAVEYVRVIDRMLEHGVDVAVNSWGPMVYPFDTAKDQALYNMATKKLVIEGREGLGVVTLFASGNDRLGNMNTNYDPTDNMPTAIVVAASDQTGNITSYSTPGASVLVSAPGSDPSSMVTTDRLGELGYNTQPGEAGNYTDLPGSGFNGTSSAAPVAAGVVALMLEANPGLGYRDVQEILAYSSVRADLIGRADRVLETIAAFNEKRGPLPDAIANYLPKAGATLEHSYNNASDWNGGGHLISHHYGFGRIDALAAIRLAETWSKTSTISNVVEHKGLILQEEGSASPGSVTQYAARFDQNARVEQMLVTVQLETQASLGLTLELVSPDGTVSQLVANPAPYTRLIEKPVTGEVGFFPIEDDLVTELEWQFNSVRHWGENLAGEWVLRVVNDNSTEAITLHDWSLDAITAAPSAGTQIFTNEFSSFAQMQPERLELQVANGTHINAAAVTQASVLNLANGQASIAGTAVTLDDPASFRNLTSGDGDDTLVGNAADNILMPGRGNNSVDGGAGVDVLRLIGNDSLYSVTSQGNGAVTVSNVGLSGGGTDTANNIELLVFTNRVLLADTPQSLGTGAFDEAWYLNQNPDVAAAVAAGQLGSGQQHYAQWGAAEARNPNVLFNEAWYLNQNADVAQAVGSGALASGYQHYLSHGWAEHRNPSAWMNGSEYLQANADVAAAGMNPLLHYLNFGVHEDRVIVATPYELWV
ncbi:MAG: S8 family serine peptidase [Alcaligenaceae bacterium]|nr:S8 family serine peptidase [Alcaligenaceae bacterium]